MRPPLPGEAPDWRPLLTTDLDCELETVCEEEGEVLETSGDDLEVVTAIISYRDRVRMTRTVTEIISSIVVLELCQKHNCSPFVHEGMVVSIAEGEVIERVVLLADRVLDVGAGGAVVPGEGDHGPAVVKVGGEDKVVGGQMTDDCSHLWLPVLEVDVQGTQRGPVREASVEVFVVCVGPRLPTRAVRVQRGKEVELAPVEEGSDLLVKLVLLTQGPGQFCQSQIY